MFMQPVLAAALAAALVCLPRARWTAPAAVVLLAVCCAPTALHYTRVSQGEKSGGITEAKLASILGPTAPVTPPGTRLLADINNLVAAKVAAVEFRGTDLRFLSRDYYQQIAPIEFERLGNELVSLHPHFEDLARTRAILTVSPNNPTGAVYPAAALRAVNALCAAHGLYHFHDEAYAGFAYDGATTFSPAAIPGVAAHTLSFFSMSKAYGFASWRIGWMVYPAHLESALRKIQDTLVICPPVIAQFAAVGALFAGAPYVREKLAELTAVRAVVRRELALGDEHGVAVIPGGAFGVTGSCTVRVAYGALAKDTVAEGIGRFATGLRALLK
eukprot:gene38340-51782_t